MVCWLEFPANPNCSVILIPGFSEARNSGTPRRSNQVDEKFTAHLHSGQAIVAGAGDAGVIYRFWTLAARGASEIRIRARLQACRKSCVMQAPSGAEVGDSSFTTGPWTCR